jgi:hypothetical protein
VSTALLETWVRRSGDTLTLSGYTQAGGVRGAVAHLANGVYDRLDPSGQEILRHIFLRLTDPQGASNDVRRRAHRDEIATNDAERVVLEQLISHRLVTATEDTVEVAHEALLREWPRLRTWLEEGREVVGCIASSQTPPPASRQPGRRRTVPGVRLEAAREWAGSHPGDTNPTGAEFLTASNRPGTLLAGPAHLRRLRSLAVGLAALLVIAVVAGVLLAVQRSETRKQANRPSRAGEETNRLATLKRTLPDDQRDLALLLGAQGYRIEQSDESAGGLQAAMVQTPPGLDRIIRYRSPTLGPHLDHAGQLLAVPGQDGTVTIYDVASGRVVRTMTWPRPREIAVFSGDDHYVAAGGLDGQVAIWDRTTGQLSGAPLPVGGNRASAVFDPTDSSRLYAVRRHRPADDLGPTRPRPSHQVGTTLYFTGGEPDGGRFIRHDQPGWSIRGRRRLG